MLIINKDKFSIQTKSEILDETDNVKYWCQPDFAFKGRLHVYDENNDEIGYVQYKILKSQDGVEYYDHKDNKINVDDYCIDGEGFNLQITKNNSIVLNSKESDEKVMIDCKDNISLLILFGLIK